MTVTMALLAFALERLSGYPDAVQRWIGHPVEWIGALIARLDRRLNRSGNPAFVQRMLGVLGLVAVLTVTGAVAVAIHRLLALVPFGWGIEALLAAPLLASRQLGTYVRSVADGLDTSLAAGREALSHIVGRDTAELDEPAVARAAIETLAENTSDGVIAPLFWMLLFGLPGIAIYKAINTADSMLGHLNDRHRHFGWASAKLDDLVNLAPARLTALLIAGAAQLSRGTGQAAWKAAREDGPRQDSPNSGWPESAMAGALGLMLGGPRNYRGERTDLPWMGDGTDLATAQHIRDALGVYDRTCLLAGMGLVAMAGLPVLSAAF